METVESRHSSPVWRAGKEQMMSLQFFGTRGRDGTSISLQRERRESLRWVPRIGEEFPDFTAVSSRGTLKFREWAAGSWVYFFSHPGAFTPVCTTELAAVANRAEAFAGRDVRVLMLSRDQSGLQQEWIAEVEALFGVEVGFPAIADPEGVLARSCGMIHPGDDCQRTIRKSFVIDPRRRIRMIFEYPARVGRNLDETLRVIDALQEVDRLNIATPAGWTPGDTVVLPREMPEREADLRFGDRWERVTDYLRVFRRG